MPTPSAAFADTDAGIWISYNDFDAMADTVAYVKDMGLAGIFTFDSGASRVCILRSFPGVLDRLQQEHQLSNRAAAFVMQAWTRSWTARSRTRTCAIWRGSWGASTVASGKIIRTKTRLLGEPLLLKFRSSLKAFGCLPCGSLSQLDAPY